MGDRRIGAGDARVERIRRRTSSVRPLAPGYVLAATLLASRPIPGTADPSTSAFVVQRDPEAMGYPDEAAPERGIVERLGNDPFVQLTSDGWLVDVWSQGPEPGRGSARILLSDGQRILVGTHRIDSREAGCDRLSTTVTMTLAMVLEAQAPAGAPSARRETRVDDSSTGAIDLGLVYGKGVRL